MVADNTDRHIIIFILPVLLTGQIFNTLYDRLENLCLIDTLLSLQDSDSSLNTHTSINALSLHLNKASISFLSVTHENIIPDFEVLTALTTRLTIWSTSRTACINKHLRVWTTRTCLTGRTPPVVFTRHEINSVFTYAKALPGSSSFLITRNIFISCKNSNRKLLFLDTKPLCKEFKAISDSFFLKVSPKGPVSKHLKEGQMVRVTYCVDITGSDTLLIINKHISSRMGSTKDIWNKWMHSCCCEEDGWIILRYKGSARNLLMALRNEEINIHFSKFVCCNRFHNAVSIFLLS